MDHDRLLVLIDHPAPDPDAAHNPVLTARVMERVRHAGAPQPTASMHRIGLWSAFIMLLTISAITVPSTGAIADGGLASAANLFNGMLVELVVGALIAVTVLGITLGRKQSA